MSGFFNLPSIVLTVMGIIFLPIGGSGLILIALAAGIGAAKQAALSTTRTEMTAAAEARSEREFILACKSLP